MEVEVVVGFATKEAVILEEELSQVAHVTVTTDDGSYGTKGYVSTIVDQMDQEFDAIYSCGAPGMLKYVNTKFHDHPAPIFPWNRVWLVGWVLAMPV